MDDTQYDTNLGWWTDKPEQPGLPPSGPRHSARPVNPSLGLRVWRNVALLVALMVALAWTLKVAVGL